MAPDLPSSRSDLIHVVGDCGHAFVVNEYVLRRFWFHGCTVCHRPVRIKEEGARVA